MVVVVLVVVSSSSTGAKEDANDVDDERNDDDGIDGQSSWVDAYLWRLFGSQESSHAERVLGTLCHDRYILCRYRCQISSSFLSLISATRPAWSALCFHLTLIVFHGFQCSRKSL